jgi:phage shock protein C
MADHLYRSRDDRMLAGVAGGLAEMWDADPSLVRLIWALLTIFTGGIALVVYIVMAIVVPEEDDAYLPPAPPPGSAPFAPTAGQANSHGADPTAAPGAATAPPVPAPPSAPSATPPPAYWMPGSGASRVEARRARRAARRQRGDGAAPLVIGVFLVLLGGFFLARQWLPDLNWDWFWPVMLIALGVLLLVLALTRHPSEPGNPS